jgi:coenzyme F420-0:L-glutamate ligase/coenzyme F420-1:gamma-L-glutamate ligase
MTTQIRAIAVRGIGEVKPGDALAEVIADALRRQRLRLRDGDIVIVKHKIVSKAEAQLVRLEDVHPSARARRWAQTNDHDARVVELALREARRVLRMKHVLVTETRHGFVCANSGVDVSNVDGGRSAVLLPRDPDASARKLQRALQRRLKVEIAVIISDSFGRPWREGLTEVALGVAGLGPLLDFRGRTDGYGYNLHATQEAVADELACVGGLVCGKLGRAPVCVIRGYRFEKKQGSGRALIRPRDKDLFR